MAQSFWRIIRHPPAVGAWNMAVDEAILDGVNADQSPPTLRLYAWQPACLSLGYAQPFTDVDLGALALHGWSLVRRPTGGRAILHVDELTYSVIGPSCDPSLTGGVLESYRRLSQALLKALLLLGLPAQADREYSQVNSIQTSGPVCFEVPSNYEITIAGKKLIGSAQARRGKGVLQHGSLPLTGDLARITLGLNFDCESDREQAATRLLARALTVETALNKVISWQQAAEAFKAGFESTMDITFVPGELTENEINHAKDLQAQKYAHPNWSERV